MNQRPQSAEMTPGPGFRITSDYPSLSRELVEHYSKFETPDISDMLNRMYTMSSDIKNLVNDKPLCGVACTVKVYPGDNLMVHKALDIARPGDIIVVDAGGHTGNAVFGDMVATKAKHRGVAGFIIDGLTRDLPGLKEVGLPVYTIGVSPIGPLHRGPGEVNHPISCGGIVVKPGDLVVADSNGVVVVRNEFAESILGKLVERQASLEGYIAKLKKGEFSNEWVDKLLNDNGCFSE
ncbi:RraA family protein [Aurantivibrio plasticivorans]